MNNKCVNSSISYTTNSVAHVDVAVAVYLDTTLDALIDAESAASISHLE